jgi:UDP-N-acetylglucosamine acyltransferase
MNTIHPTAIIGDSVELGDGNVIGPYVTLLGNTRVGSNNWIGSHVSIGAPAEIRDADRPTTWEQGTHFGTVEIGDNNVIRESCVIHAGFISGTYISGNCYIMNQTYVAHDCNISDDVTLSSNVALGGHVVIQDGANLGLGTVVHQRRVIGASAMIGMGSVVTRDIFPFAKAYGNPCRVQDINRVGMSRLGYGSDDIELVAAYLLGNTKAELSARLLEALEAFQLVTKPSSNEH